MSAKVEEKDEPEDCSSNGWRVSVKNAAESELAGFEVMESKWIDNAIISVHLTSGNISCLVQIYCLILLVRRIFMG